MKSCLLLCQCLGLLLSAQVFAQSAPLAEQVVDVPTRSGVTQRMLVLEPDNPKAVVVLFAGGDGGLQIKPNGHIGNEGGNFLVRTRQQFAAQGFLVAVVDAPSDRQSEPFLNGFRQNPEHATDIKAVIAWLRQKTTAPIWLVGTSRGTQSAAYIATVLAQDAGGPDGLVLTSTILADKKGRPVQDMPLDRVKIPTLVMHHKEDSCKACPQSELPHLMDKLSAAPRKELIMEDGGISEGDPCEAFAHHGYNGIESEVVTKIAQWITQK